MLLGFATTHKPVGIFPLWGTNMLGIFVWVLMDLSVTIGV